MAIKFDTKKGAEKLSSFLQKTADAGKSAADSVQKGAAALSDKVKEDSYQHRLAKYNPLFSEEYTAEDFILPHLIVIADEAVRRGIDVCEGAIGWRSIQAETEVLHLYSTSAALKNIEFYPAVTTDATYYVDNFNPNRYINVDCIFSKAHEERLAELEDVALMLGAKSCTIEIAESTQEANASGQSAGFGGKLMSIGKLGFRAEQSTASKHTQKRSGAITSEFEGHNNPQYPKLKWFANHENIKKLIETRCANPSAIKNRTLKISGSSSSTMTQKAALAIDCLKGLHGSASMQSQVMVEHSCELLFTIEF